ncbi:MAG: fluoride efflux transporter CrcB [Termitinemataceae bacterium]|nr:MAG: fluoride efflux transporter CrcB [Termitinemataceae bacterium]
MKIVAILFGGGLGAVLRYLCSEYLNSVCSTVFSVGTLAVNTIGAFLIGFSFNLFGTYSVAPELRLFLITGFLGGFTTFSTYSLETVQLLLDGNVKAALLNLALNNILCIIFVISGMALSRLIAKHI